MYSVLFCSLPHSLLCLLPFEGLRLPSGGDKRRADVEFVTPDDSEWRHFEDGDDLSLVIYVITVQSTTVFIFYYFKLKIKLFSLHYNVIIIKQILSFFFVKTMFEG